MVLTILLVILGIALVVVFLNREKDEEKAKLAIGGLTVAIVAVAIMSLVGIDPGASRGPQFDTNVDQAIGEIAADRIAQEASGSQVVLVADPNPHNPFSRARIEAFQKRLPAHNKQIVGVQSPWPDDPSAHEFPDEGLTAWGIQQALRSYPNAEIIISLAGFPMHNFDTVERDLRSVEFYAIDENFYSDLGAVMRQGAVNGLIIPPFDSNWTDLSGSNEDIFDRRYVFVTPDNLSQVAHRFVDPYEETW